MNILDTTIRDGSYTVDFKFTCEDVQDIVSKLVRLGVHYIEIGHGMGLHASSIEHGEALHTDEEYITAAKKVSEEAELGVFCIPGIARLEDLRFAKETGISFVRIGVNANQYEKAIPYIHEARKQNLTVMINFMKSYIITPKEFASTAAAAQCEGAQVVYIVDSAGCMNETMLSEYSEAVRGQSAVMLGFHGHNNIGLAVSNTVKCVEMGFDFIDCSFQGLGRSLGNASLEQTVIALKKQGYPIEMDIPRLLEYGYSSLRNIVNKDLMHPLDLICGYAGFHSGYLKQIYKCTTEKKVDPMRLILAYSEMDRRDMDYELLSRVADGLPKDYADNPYRFNEYFYGEA